jgi:hypothetical protein
MALVHSMRLFLTERRTRGLVKCCVAAWKVLNPLIRRSMEAPPSALSSRPKRSEVKGSAVQRTSRGNAFQQSAAQWRDLLFLLVLTQAVIVSVVSLQ